MTEIEKIEKKIITDFLNLGGDINTIKIIRLPFFISEEQYILINKYSSTERLLINYKMSIEEEEYFCAKFIKDELDFRNITIPENILEL